jgi:phosphoserine phosphatase
MTHVLSLIAAETKALSANDLDQARSALHSAGADCGPPDWLSPEAACDIPFQGPTQTALTAVRQALAGEPVDVNVVPAISRRKKLLLADMDSTLIEQECVNELAAEIGLRDQVAAITERAMRGDIAFEPALRERVALFKGLPLDVVSRVLATRITLSPGAAVLVATMRASGAHTMIVSGGFTLFTGDIAERLGFDEHQANRLLHDGGAFTGILAEPVLGGAAKEETLDALTRRLGLERAETLAIGDGANDVGMILRAGLGVAYRAKPALHAVADATIDHADLTGALFLQGYRRDEFATAAKTARA